MKNPTTLIKEREAAMPPPLPNRLRLYTYIRPIGNGEAALEVWGARNNPSRKGNPLVTKCFYKMRTDRKTARVRDVLYYSSWSCAAHDHLCYSFPEAGLTDYFTAAEKRQGGNWREMRGAWSSVDFAKRSEYKPLVATMLNAQEWANTRYRYCGFDANCGMFILDYLRLWKSYPKAEILSKAQCFQLLTEDFLKRLDEDKAFASYVARYRVPIREHGFEPKQVYRHFKRNTDLFRLAQSIAERRRAKEEAEARREAEKFAQYNEQISALYERVKDICATYGAYEVIVPQTAEEMLTEGKAMHNCVGHCYAPRQGKEDLCIFLHKDGKACVDIRIDLATFKLMECRAVCNRNAEESAWIVAHELARMVKLRLAA